MANYVNLFNNTDKALNIEIVPKNQASIVTFKGEPPINYQRGDDGVFRFTLATTMLDRMGLAIAFPMLYVFEKVDGIFLENPIEWTGLKYNDPRDDDMVVTTDHDLAQLGIGVMRARSNAFYQGEFGQELDSVYLYNLNKNKNVVLEGYIIVPDMNMPPMDGGEVIEMPSLSPQVQVAMMSVTSESPQMTVPILRQRSTSLFNDPDLDGDSMIVDQDYNVGIALGGLHKPAGTGMTWQMAIYDQDDPEALEGTLYVAVTVEHDEGDSVPLVYSSTITRDSTTTLWSESIDYDALNEAVITSLNEQYAEATGFEYPLFADARTESAGALFLISFTYEVESIVNPFLPDVLTDSLDGSWGEVGPIYNEPAPMAMVASAPSLQTMSLEGGSDQFIEDGEEEYEEYNNPLFGIDWISVRVQGTPLLNMKAIAMALNNVSPDSDLELPEDQEETMLAELYRLQNVRLVVHTANPEEGKPLAHFGHNTQNSTLRKWGEDTNDFAILTAGVLTMSLRQEFEEGPQGPEDSGEIIYT